MAPISSPHLLLRDFQQKKKQLLGLADELKEIAADSGDKDTLSVLNRFGSSFAESTFLVVVVGEFKRGKSTLVNALVGKPICPVSVTPKTARLTRILPSAAGKDSIAVFFKRERDPEKLPWTADAMERLVARQSEAHREVSSVDVYVQPGIGLSQPGLAIVDTPGLESLFKEHDTITKEYLPRADLVVLCLSATQPLSAKERDFLIGNSQLWNKTLITFNHFDVVPEAERSEALRFVTDSLRTEVFGPALSIEPIPVSAKLAMEAKTPEDLDLTGIPVLRETIVKRIAQDNAYPVLEQIARRHLDVVTIMSKQTSVARDARTAGETQDVRDRVERTKSQISAHTSALSTRVLGHISQNAEVLAQSTFEQMESWRAELKRQARALVVSYSSEQACRQHLPKQLADLLLKWLGAYEKSIRTRFESIHRDVGIEARTGFAAMEKDAAEALAPGKAYAGLAEISSAAEALKELGSLSNCIGGAVGGYGLAKAAVEPAFNVPAELKVLTGTAGLMSVIAMIGGPIGWGVAAVGWLAVALVNLVRSNTWQERVIKQLDAAIDDPIVASARAAVTKEIRSSSLLLQDHHRDHITAVGRRLCDVLDRLATTVSQGRSSARQELGRLDERQKRLNRVAAAIRDFLASSSVTAA